MHIQIQQNGLALQTREADVHIVGQTGAAAAVQAGFRDVLEDAVDDVIAQLALVGHALIQMRRGDLQCLAHGSNAGHVLGACTVAGLLTAAIDQVLGPYALTAVQCTHALGAIELVGAHGQHIHAQLLHVHRDGTHSLHRIGVHPHAMLVGNLGDLLDGLDGADLVVGHHDADQCGVGTDGSLHVLGADVALGGGTDIGHLKAHALQCSHAVHDGMMLKSAGDEVLFVLACLGEGGALYRPVVGLGAAAGKEELSRTCIDGLCHLRTAGVHEFLCLIADAVMAAGVAAGTAQGFDHHFQCLGSTGSGGSIIQINHFFHVFHRNDPFLLNASAGALNALCRCGILSTDKLYHIIP